MSSGRRTSPTQMDPRSINQPTSVCNLCYIIYHYQWIISKVNPNLLKEKKSTIQIGEYKNKNSSCNCRISSYQHAKNASFSILSSLLWSDPPPPAAAVHQPQQPPLPPSAAPGQYKYFFFRIKYIATHLPTVLLFYLM